MKSFYSILLLLSVAFYALRAEEPPVKKTYTVYAQFLEDTPVDLSTGARWMMDKGDCFPVYMFKNQQTKIVLQLASATFMVDASRMRILKDADAGTALQSYRKNLATFLKTQSDAWQKDKGNKGEKGEKAANDSGKAAGKDQ